MRGNGRAILLLALAFLSGGWGHAAKVTFTPRELFRIPFGTGREALGARVDGDRFIIPRDFSMDGAGRFYIDDPNNHRIARYSFEGKYEMGFRYPSTARQVFAHPDSRQNLWLLISDPARGMYYGVYDPRGQALREGIFSRFDHFRLHLDDDYTLHVILSSKKGPAAVQTYLLDEKRLLMKKETIAPPPKNHHKVRKSDRVYFVDPVPGTLGEDSVQLTRITDESRRGVADIKGRVVYVTELGDVYTRVGKREIRVYGIDGSLKGKVFLKGLSSACASIRFDALGHLYELDGIPDQTDEQVRGRVATLEGYDDFEDLHYTPAMTGMRLIQWERRPSR